MRIDRSFGLATLLALAACKRDPAPTAGTTSASANGAESASTAASASSGAIGSGAPSAAIAAELSSLRPPKPTEPIAIGASYFEGSNAADAIAALRSRQGGALRLLDLHIYPARIVLKAKAKDGDALERWDLRPTATIGPKVEGLSATKLAARLFGDDEVPLARLPAEAQGAIAKSGLANASITHLDVRRAPTGGVTLRFSVHGGGVTKWVDVDVPAAVK